MRDLRPMSARCLRCPLEVTASLAQPPNRPTGQTDRRPAQRCGSVQPRAPSLRVHPYTVALIYDNVILFQHAVCSIYELHSCTVCISKCIYDLENYGKTQIIYYRNSNFYY